jgi:hypothetical protein
VLSAETNPLYAAALTYADRGWRLVPLHECTPPATAGGPFGCSCGRRDCESQGKHPRLKEWQKVASSERDLIAEWWRKWPSANVGVALGAASGIVSIDVDSEAGGKLLKDLAGGQTDPTLTYRTGKGWRALYAIPKNLPSPPATHAIAIDGAEAVRFQSDGGQCVMPPSLHPYGKRYEWVKGRSLEGGTLAEMPEWLVLEMCRPKSPPWSDQAARNTFLKGKDFNFQADWWKDILSPAGFTRAGSVNGVDRYTRPGKKSGISVTVGHYKAGDSSPALYVFSGSIPQLEAGRCYDKFGAFARLCCSGDFQKAAEEIQRQGFAKRGKANDATVQTQPAEPARWQDPIPLDDPSPRVRAFPLAVLPQALQDLCATSAEAVGCPPDYAATHALAVAAGAIGGAYDLQVKRGFYVPSILWACVVAPPGSGKSPSVAPILKPVFEEQRARKANGNDKPAYVGDVTVERLARLLEQDTRGLSMIWDEMAGWLTSFNQYKAKGSGNDRAHYLSIWDGRPLKVDRAGPDKPPIFVQRPRLSIVGGIQPEVLDSLREGPSDGFFDRILFSFPADTGLSVETFAEPDERAEAEWGKAFANIRKRMPRRDQDGEHPCVVTLNEDGRPIWQAWTQELASRAAEVGAPSYFRNLAAKHQGYAARLALVGKIIHEAYAEIDGRTWHQGIAEVDMQRGVILADYFLDHAARVRRAAGRDRRLEGARAIDRWLRENRPKKFTRSDLWASLRRNSAFAAPEDLESPLTLLRDHRIVRFATSGGYEINPAVLREAEPGREGAPGQQLD